MAHYMVNTEGNKIYRPLGGRRDPHLGCNFLVEFDGIIFASFTDVSGLSVETQVERKTFGGENDREYAFVTQTKYSDITLKHGITDMDFLWSWYRNIVNGRITKRHGTIHLLDPSGNTAVRWDLYDAFPIKWEGPTFNASSSAVAIETLVIAHQGLKMHR